MKYDEIHNIEFVICGKISNHNKHESELDDGCCKTCIELYDEFTGELINEYEQDHKGKIVWDFMEIAHEPDTDRLSFGVWYKNE